YQLRHCPRVNRTQKLVCDLHQSPIIANVSPLDKSGPSLATSIATWGRHRFASDAGGYSTVNFEILSFSSFRRVPKRKAQSRYGGTSTSCVCPSASHPRVRHARHYRKSQRAQGGR